MSTNDFDPTQSSCVDWRKISPSYPLPPVTDCAVCIADKRSTNFTNHTNPTISTKLSRCSGCLRVFYCGVKHQKQHWTDGHKNQCCPFKIVQGGPSVGRIVIATRDIPAGDIIMEEPPVTVGPKQYTKPVCLGCMRIIDKECFVRCSKCGWPMCSVECQSRQD